jgi:hypothetical protein
MTRWVNERKPHDDGFGRIAAVTMLRLILSGITRTLPP